MNALLAVFIGGGLGSLARFGISVFSLKYINGAFPWGTLISNTVACIIVALTVVFFKEKIESQTMVRFFIISGFCGGFSTFSTFSFETYALFRNEHLWLGILNISISLFLGLFIMFYVLKDAHWNV